MKKKILCFAAAVMMAFSATTGLAAEETKTPGVRVDDRTIFFADQEPVILPEESRILVPARGVFEAMDATVEWEQENQLVVVNSYNNVIRLLLWIDKAEMEVYTFTSLMNAEKTVIELDAKPQLMNDRTMIPLRAISEALKADVAWNPENYQVEITSAQYQKFIAENTTDEQAYDAKTILPRMYITADKEEVKAGDTVTISICMENVAALGENLFFSGMSAGIFYDANQFTAGTYQPIIDGETVDAIVGGSNPHFNQAIKFAYILDPTKNFVSKDGVICTLQFYAKQDGPAVFTLSDRITDRGTDTMIMYKQDGKNISFSDFDELYIDTIPVELK